MSTHEAYQVKVVIPDHFGVGSTGSVNMHTALFRRDMPAREVLEMARTIRPEGSQVTIDSLGSSIGAEADTFMAHNKKQGYFGHVVTRGYDMNELATQHATAGQYLGADDLKDAMRDVPMLQHFGFITSEAKREPPKKDKLVIDSTRVRAGYEVAFDTANILDGLPEQEPADIVLVNDVLHHLDLMSARGVLQVAGRRLSRDGILVMGAESEYNRQRQETAHADFLREIHGLEPRPITDTPGAHVVYTRAA